MKGMENSFLDTEHNLPTCPSYELQYDLGDPFTDYSLDCQRCHFVHCTKQPSRRRLSLILKSEQK